MIKILGNCALVLPDYEQYESAEIDGHTLSINTNYERELHFPTSGVVIKAPDKLIYSSLPEDREALLYDVSMDIEVGDRVIFGYNIVEDALKQGKCLGGAVYIRYDELVCAIRGDQIIMLNGYMIVEAMQDHNPAGEVVVPEYLQSVNHYESGKILKCGGPVKRYRMYPEIGGDVPGEMQEGDQILFHMQYSIPLQYQMHSIINTGKELYRMQQKDVSAVMI